MLTKTIPLSLLTVGFLSASCLTSHAGPAAGIESFRDTSPTRPVVSIASDEMVTGARNFIENVSQRGLNFLSNEDLSHKQRRQEFRELLNDSFDLKTIGRFALGRYWRVASPEQRKEYQKLFEDMVVESYAKRFSEYQGQKLTILKSRSVGDQDALVQTEIVSTSNNAPNVQVDWRVRYKDGQYQIIDVIVEGVSMTLTQRSEFSSIIQRGGGNMEALLQRLRNKT
jgi:phospholipid transport system substrate-binding protein